MAESAIRFADFAAYMLDAIVDSAVDYYIPFVPYYCDGCSRPVASSSTCSSAASLCH